MTLEKLRNEMDEINIEVVKLLAKRVSLARSIAQLKKEQSHPIEDLTREKLQYEELRRLAEKYQLHASVVEKIFYLIIEYCKVRMGQEM